MEPEKENLYDAIVIGGGPAGLTAALYLARARYRVLVVEKDHFGGQITITAEVVNYPGVEQTSGTALTESMLRQAQSFGAEFLLAEVESLDVTDTLKTVKTSRGIFRAFGILLATGAHPRMIGFRGEEAFKGRGVAYCATCDGEFFTGRDIVVVGGGFAAAEESVFLTRYARRVTILIRGADFSCAESVADAARSHEKITVLTNTELEEVGGDTVLRYARWRNTKTGEITEYRPPEGFGVFVFGGYEPAVSLVRDLGILDARGYVITDGDQKTGVEGLYAAGDVCAKNLRQVVTAVGDGAAAAAALEKYAQTMREATGLRSIPPVTRLPRSVETAPEKKPEDTAGGEGFFTPEIKVQLAGVFKKMARPLVLHLALDDRPVSEELRHFMEELSAITDKLSLRILPPESCGKDTPWVGLYLEDGTYRGIVFHGVPGGHEFNSFVIGLYNAAGPGQPLEADLEQAIRAIETPVSMKILVSLACTMCPELVIAAQRMAAENPRITAEAYDLNHFPDLREQYRVMSVPCLVINDTIAGFGKKNVRELLGLLSGVSTMQA
ncbi:FAD-dependent oxidoreductase [Treponema sp. TIM-1]|uniref:FAD-dependent oxidoreductase n=1 Tax=Treponema sp. TIM-1 TaxID=2898417 RepID=UPI00397F46FA